MPTTIHNWARTVEFTPAELVEPRDVDEVRAIVRRARAEGRKVRVVGSLHSWSAIAATDGVALRMTHLAAISEVEQGAVWVQPGATLRQLAATLYARGWSLAILGSIDAQTVAGALATGTHGSSARHGSLADSLRAIRLVDGRGELIEIAEDDPRLDACRVHLGALGVVVGLKLAVEPAFHVRERTEIVPLDVALREFQSIRDSAAYVKLWWLPPADRVAIFRWERVPAGSPVVAPNALERAIESRVLMPYVFPFILWLGATFPPLINPLGQLVSRAYLRPHDWSGPMHTRFPIDVPPVHHEAEWALPAEHGPAALHGLRELVRSGHTVNFIQELRWVKADRAWLSPAYGRDTVYVSAYSAGPRQGRVDAFLTAAESMCRGLDGRPHWGKLHGSTPGDLGRLYPRAADFRALRAQLDPDGVFASPVIDRLLAE